MPRVFVSIGSNIERDKNIRAAVHALRARYARVAVSSVYETAAEGFDGDDFYNLVAAFDTDETLEAVCEYLTGVEAAQGRVRTGERFAPRTLDIDVLLYGQLVRHDEKFRLPRPDLRTYAHVLGPLMELAPDLVDPETGETWMNVWKRLARRDGLRKVQLK